MKISRKPTPRPRPTAPSQPPRLVTADTALARASGMGLGDKVLRLSRRGNRLGSIRIHLSPWCSSNCGRTKGFPVRCQVHDLGTVRTAGC